MQVDSCRGGHPCGAASSTPEPAAGDVVYDGFWKPITLGCIKENEYLINRDP